MVWSNLISLVMAFSKGSLPSSERTRGFSQRNGPSEENSPAFSLLSLQDFSCVFRTASDADWEERKVGHRGI